MISDDVRTRGPDRPGNPNQNSFWGFFGFVLFLKSVEMSNLCTSVERTIQR